MSAPDLHTLDVPPDVTDNGGHEVLRAFVSNGAVSVAMRRSFDDPFVWGMLLADLARHAARIYAAEAEMSEAEAMARIVEAVQAELETSTDTGATNAIN